MFVFWSQIFLLVVYDRVLFLICVKHPLIMTSALGILLMSFVVITGHISKYLQLTAFAHVSCTGVNAAACRYLTELSFPLT